MARTTSSNKNLVTPCCPIASFFLIQNQNQFYLRLTLRFSNMIKPIFVNQVHATPTCALQSSQSPICLPVSNISHLAHCVFRQCGFWYAVDQETGFRLIQDVHNAMSSSSPSKKVKADKNQVAPTPSGKGDKQYDSSKAKQSSSKPSTGKGGIPPPVPKKSTKIGFQVEEPVSDALEGDWQVDGDKEWSIDHCKVLYLISLYARPALTPDDKEGWIRRYICFYPVSLPCDLRSV
jgi:hypothetical protein